MPYTPYLILQKLETQIQREKSHLDSEFWTFSEGINLAS